MKNWGKIGRTSKETTTNTFAKKARARGGHMGGAGTAGPSWHAGHTDYWEHARGTTTQQYYYSGTQRRAQAHGDDDARVCATRPEKTLDWFVGSPRKNHTIWIWACDTLSS